MANKKTINTKSGERLRELILALNMTYSEFGKTVNLSERTINSYVSNTRRLTEDNARIITQKYPVVRYEWLMGWDDFKDEAAYKTAHYLQEEYRVRKDEMDWWRREAKVVKILKVMGYDLTSLVARNASVEERESIIFEETNRKLHSYIHDKNIDPEFIIDQFSKKELEMFIAEMQRIGVGVNEYDKYDDYDESDREYIAKNYDELLSNAIKYAAEWEADKATLIYNEKYCLCDMDNNIITEMSGKDYETFVNEVFNVISALIKYHITP